MARLDSDSAESGRMFHTFLMHLSLGRRSGDMVAWQASCATTITCVMYRIANRKEDKSWILCPPGYWKRTRQSARAVWSRRKLRR
jgi:hypothetical protein